MVKKSKKKQKKVKDLEKFVLKQIEEYVKIHKKHEKDLSYIG